MLSGCNKTDLLPGVPGFDLSAHMLHDEKPCEHLQCLGVLRVNTVQELIYALEENSEKLRKMLVW